MQYGDSDIRRAAEPITDLMTADEVAELLAVPTQWVRDHTGPGLLPSVGIGPCVRYRRESIEAWIGEQKEASDVQRRDARLATQAWLDEFPEGEERDVLEAIVSEFDATIVEESE